ncbi:hypothetical protein JYU34_001718 [Plutella xylostella]|uniref:Uncharacterized protein n=1 Tax=Plutella xylostella TaxID=51655 RepID=A0ABQ7R4L9_PLUXY|nr:hypothetical protein JYU34_001718 [Plutella xylostella]
MIQEASPSSTVRMLLTSHSQYPEVTPHQMYCQLKKIPAPRHVVEIATNLGDAAAGTRLLSMVRARQQASERHVQQLQLPSEDSEDEVMAELCPHGWTRETERSVSRSRASRMSSKRDMDIPSLMAFTASVPSKLPTHLEIPAFQRAKSPAQEAPPRWSIRRSLCPVCSQKWKDRSSVNIVKSSGLKRNLSSEFSSVIAPARLRTYVSKEYVPRSNFAAVHEESGTFHSAGAAWQLSRARKLHAPNLGPPPATEAPAAAAPLARKDLDVRVHRFLANLQQDC